MIEQAASPSYDSTRALVFMGVSGAGKTTVAELFALQTGWQFIDADSLHSPENIEKMRSGRPLTDEDRAPWLQTLRQTISGWLQEGRPGVLACSALKHEYRETLKIDASVHFVYLKAGFELLSSRLSHRQGHYMKAAMLESQLATLQEPSEALVIDAAQPPETIVQQIRQYYKLVSSG